MTYKDRTGCTARTCQRFGTSCNRSLTPAGFAFLSTGRVPKADNRKA